MSETKTVTLPVYVLYDKWIPAGCTFNFEEDIKQRKNAVYSPEYYMTYDEARSEFDKLAPIRGEKQAKGRLFVFMYHVLFNFPNQSQMLDELMAAKNNGCSLDIEFDQMMSTDCIVLTRTDPLIL